MEYFNRTNSFHFGFGTRLRYGRCVVGWLEMKRESNEIEVVETAAAAAAAAQKRNEGRATTITKWNFILCMHLSHKFYWFIRYAHSEQTHLYENNMNKHKIQIKIKMCPNQQIETREMKMNTQTAIVVGIRCSCTENNRIPFGCNRTTNAYFAFLALDK